MMSESTDKALAELRLLAAQTDKALAETAALHRAAETERTRLGKLVIEGIKVFGAIVIGIGGAVAGYSGYQLSEAKKERYELDAREAQGKLQDAQEKTRATQAELDAASASLKAKREAAATMDIQLALARAALDKLQSDIGLAQGSSRSPATTAALERASKSASQLSQDLASVSTSAGDVQGVPNSEKLYYVIALTTTTRESAEAEIRRVGSKLGPSFEARFPSIEVYGPSGGPYTVLLSREALPFAAATRKKQEAVAAGFSKETWLWQSGVSYFDEKRKGDLPSGLERTPVQ
ncbi:MAG: hypothetical protein ACOY7P_08700 [Pseudomonadota bacterium]